MIPSWIRRPFHFLQRNDGLPVDADRESTSSYQTAQIDNQDFTSSTCKDSSNEATQSSAEQPLIPVNTGHSIWKQTQLLGKNQLNSSKASLISTGSSLFCRICHITDDSKENPLISPCRCAGSLQFIHKRCLVRWLELSTVRMVPHPRCELCNYTFRTSSILKVSELHFPKISQMDAILNFLFFIAFTCFVLICSGTLRWMHIAEQMQLDRRRKGLSQSTFNSAEISIMIGTGLVFISFFSCLLTQYKAETTIFKYVIRFWVINKHWTIQNYNIKYDPEIVLARKMREIAAEEGRIQREIEKNSAANSQPNYPVYTQPSC